MTGKCRIEGCATEKVRARGMCNKHYTRWQRYDDPNMVRKPGPQPSPYCRSGKHDKRIVGTESSGACLACKRIRRKREWEELKEELKVRSNSSPSRKPELAKCGHPRSRYNRGKLCYRCQEKQWQESA